MADLDDIRALCAEFGFVPVGGDGDLLRWLRGRLVASEPPLSDAERASLKRRLAYRLEELRTPRAKKQRVRRSA